MQRLVIIACLLGPVAFAQDPSKQEVSLPAAKGWKASLILDNDVGVWTVRAFQMLPRYGCPEIIGLDDKGRCTVLVSYSGKWTPLPTVRDGAWLGAIAWADIDPRREGKELYTGGKNGNLYQIVPRPGPPFDANVIDRKPAEELHTFAAGDLLPSRKGNELLAFTRRGEVYEVRPEGPGTDFDVKQIAQLPGRVRDVAVIEGETPRMIATLRAQKVLELTLREGALDVKEILSEPMGFGRIARRRRSRGDDGPEVVYVTRDDGVLLRLEEKPGGWRREIIYAGPQGPRGVISGRFSADPKAETVAVFGYSKRVQLLTRVGKGPWKAETIFTDRDKGHWLEVAEVDGRNATDEIVGSGYGARIFLLSRPPGYGLKGVATDPDVSPAKKTARHEFPRVGIRAGESAATKLSPLSYRGGFEAKTLVYDTLIHRDAKGRLVPGIAAAFHYENGGRTLVLKLREGLTFHDGTPVTAAAVALHFRRIIRLPEHGWLLTARHVQSIDVRDPLTVALTADRPLAMHPELCVINPCSLQAPSALDREGEFRRPLGTGPYRFLSTREDGRVLRLASSADPERKLDLVRTDNDWSEATKALLAGDLDALVEGWYGRFTHDAIERLKQREDLTVLRSPGSELRYLSFSLVGPTKAKKLRLAVAAAIDRKHLIQQAEHGAADPATGWGAPGIACWPKSAPWSDGGAVPALDGPLRLLVRSSGHQPLAKALRQMLGDAGIPTVVVSVNDAEFARQRVVNAYDLLIESTWGIPYDPYVSLHNRFLPPTAERNASDVRGHGVDPRLAALVEEATGVPGDDARFEVYRKIQDLMTSDALIVPLYVPHRRAAFRPERLRVKIDQNLYRFDVHPVR